MKHAEKGFTLIEIMIVVAIIAILAAIAIPNFVKYRETAQRNSCEANLTAIVSAAEAYSISTNPVPDTIDISSDLVNEGKGFLKKMPVCPAGGTYGLSKDANGIWTATCTTHAPASTPAGS